MRKEKIKILFVCNQGENRSKTAKELFSKKYETKSAGIYAIEEENMLTKELLEWADIIIVMEESHRRWISHEFPKQYMMKKILCLDIPDIYQYNQPELIDVLKMKVKKELKK